MSSWDSKPGCRFFDKDCNGVVAMSGLLPQVGVFPDTSRFNPRTFERISVPEKPLVKSGVSYHFRNGKHTISRLGVDSSNDVRIWTESRFSNDKWQVEEVAGEDRPLYHIKNIETDKYLQVADGGYGLGDNVHAKDLVHDCKTCKWQVELVKQPDVLAFKNVRSGRYLSVETGSDGNANVVIGGKDLTLDERTWQLVRASSESWTCAPTPINEATCRAQAVYGAEEFLFVGQDKKCDWFSWGACPSGCCKRPLDCSAAVQGAVRRIKAPLYGRKCKCEKVNGVEYHLRGNGFWENDSCRGEGNERYFNVMDIVNSGRSCTCQDTRPKARASDNSMASRDAAATSNAFLATAPAPDSVP